MTLPHPTPLSTWPIKYTGDITCSQCHKAVPWTTLTDLRVLHDGVTTGHVRNHRILCNACANLHHMNTYNISAERPAPFTLWAYPESSSSVGYVDTFPWKAFYRWPLHSWTRWDPDNHFDWK